MLVASPAVFGRALGGPVPEPASCEFAVIRPLPAKLAALPQAKDLRRRNSVVCVRLGLPLHKTFERVKLGQAELIVHGCRVAVAVVRTLPELPTVAAARKHRPVFLRLMLEDGELLAVHLIGAERHDPLNLMRFPLLPGPAIEPGLHGLPARLD